ncbi:MAG: iron transporter [Anaerolineales bacterium]
MADEEKRPPMKTSEETKERHLEMAKAQGEAYEKALMEMINHMAEGGGVKRRGDYLIGYALEKAEGMWQPQEYGQLTWQEPEDENLHIEVVVRDGADGRFIPGLVVQVTLLNSQNRDVGKHRHYFIWHPWLYHYGRNWKVPEEGTYTLKVHIEPPEWNRHDKKNGQRYAEEVDVTFENVEIENLGQK